jgi:hypothetical protein
MGIAAEDRSEKVAAFGFFFDQHPARVRCRSGLECQGPDCAVPFVDEVRDVEARVR